VFLTSGIEAGGMAPPKDPWARHPPTHPAYFPSTADSSALIDQVKQARTEAHCIDTDSPIRPANHAIVPQISNATNCIYTPDGKLHMKIANAFHFARNSGYHNKVMPPPKVLSS